jgi:PfaB family protein
MSHRADLMVTGGVSRPDCLYTQIGFSQLKALSRSGKCAPFDRSADGLVVGEGAGILVLKRLDDAIGDGDTIYGTICGIGLSNDMRGNLLAPESDGQFRAMRMAYAQAGWRPSDVDYIECHGAGTPVGDATELRSLSKLWADCRWNEQQCALGSVKSNIGHLLTAAGAAGLIKTLLALHHKIVPPSLKFQRAAGDSPLAKGPFRVQTDASPWPKRESRTPRRAAVSAFGFGGINAHILLEEWDNEPSQARASMPHGETRPLPNAEKQHSHDGVAIVGMALTLGRLHSLASFREHLFNGRSALVPPPHQRWRAPQIPSQLFDGRLTRAGFIDHVALRPGQFKIPPSEIPDILPQQLLMLKVSAEAMHDAGLTLDPPRQTMGAVVGISYDYEATNFHHRWALPELLDRYRKKNGRAADPDRDQRWLEDARISCGAPLTAVRTLGALGGIVASRIAREFRLGAPSFVVSAEEASGLRAIEIAMRLLRSGEADMMLAGAVDISCDERNLATRYTVDQLSRQGKVRPFDRGADGTLPGEGAVALVLKRLPDALADKDRIYAVIQGVAGASGGGNTGGTEIPSGDTYCHSLSRALKTAHMEKASIGLMETHGSGIPAQDRMEAEALHRFFDDDPKEPRTSHRPAIGALTPITGLTGAAAGLASVAKAGLCLYHQLIPPLANYRQPASEIWHNERFYIPRQTGYWSRNRIDGPRHACVASMTADNNCMHLVLGEAERSAEPDGTLHLHHRRPLGALPYGLFCLAAADKTEMVNQLGRLAEMARRMDPDDASSLASTAHRWHHQRIDAKGTQRIAMVATSMADLITNLGRMRHAVENDQPFSFDPAGKVFHPPPSAAAAGQMAFVYPGSGNHYVGMGRRLGAIWPELLQEMDRSTDRLRDQLLPQWYDPWRISWTDQWRKEAERNLIADPTRTLFGQVLFAGQMTSLLHKFNLFPDAVIGYSLGESAGNFAMGAWPDRGMMLDRLASSDLFKRQLSGAYEAVRQAWNIPQDQSITWRAAVVNRSASRVDGVIGDLDFVHRLIVNTPGQCVIGGVERQVAAAIDHLGCDAVFLDGIVAVHCDAARPAAKAYKDLHRFETKAVDGVRFYSCAFEKVRPDTPEAAAESIVQQALKGFHFPRTIEQAYADGVRTFIEVGPHASCSGMIRQILADKPHLSVAANHRSEDEALTLFKCLAAVWVSGVDLDLTPLYGATPDRDTPVAEADPGSIQVPVGAGALAPPPLPRQSRPSAANQPAATHAPGNSANPAGKVDGASPSSAENAFDFKSLLDQLDANAAATARAHDQFLDLSRDITEQFGQTFQLHNQLAASLHPAHASPEASGDGTPAAGILSLSGSAEPASPVAFTRDQCMEFAVGSAGKILGPRFDIVDTYAARVRLPDEPLMLVDRILSVEGEKMSLTAGRVVTEHDVLADAWYLDGNRAPVCISVEAGQADLFLSAYLGIDHQVKGRRTYRLLDAQIRFHRGLPQPGETIRYDIHIDKFVRHEATYLFFFRFEGFIGHQHLITMTNGCAGFFTETEVRNSGGIILSQEDLKEGPGIDGQPFEPLLHVDQESYDDENIEALRRGDAGRCFGEQFEGVALPEALRLPGQRMRLIHRIVDLSPHGGRFGLGVVKAEADIHPDDWFLTCHFVDDMVMPGTLMYECCAHTLRVLLMRLGWITDNPEVCYEPVPAVPCCLKCRGPVTPETRHVHYVVEIKQIGYRPEPFVIADAHMYADGHYIVFFKDMSMQMTGLDRRHIERFWHAKTPPSAAPVHRDPAPPPSPPLYTKQQILEFAIGRPSKAFGEPYAVFDNQRKIARLPGPPYCFIDRITSIEPQPWVLEPGGWVEAQYDLHSDAWFFGADRSGAMPFCILLEIALQPCGWLAAFAGSALKSDSDLKFRNLGGEATLHANLGPSNGVLTMRARMTKVSEAADMIIEHFDFEVISQGSLIYSGNTYFGFFSARALAKQVGLRESIYQPGPGELACTTNKILASVAPHHPEDVPKQSVCRPTGLSLPAKALLMIDAVDIACADGGPRQLGYLRGHKTVDPREWFFKAHFYQDPVCPGSLGIESFLQLMKTAALQRWPDLGASHRFEMTQGQTHRWTYRGQVIPANQTVQVDACITDINQGQEPHLTADGSLQVDGIDIYKMEGFGLQLKPLQGQ